MKSLEIRKKFFDFFIKRNHEKVASSSLIPAHNPTLLFTNAGMNQFTDLFLGLEKRNYKRAVSIQKCVRAGGKHNDLENVGFTKRHLTFFEMMGNFSFGDYFKKDAITFAWDFLTLEMKLPVQKLHVSVYKTDNEAYDMWHTLLSANALVENPASKIHRLGEAENFWQMGDTGPCGPCTEIHIDRGPEFGCKELASCGPACDCDRFLEIWNLVFMQFDRQSDGTDKPLKQTGVDTGMGLERLCSVVQNVDSVYETDLFANILQAIEQATQLTYGKKVEGFPQATAERKAAFNVLADHIRSSTLLIADGCAPSNEGRGYVLRKIIRRAAYYAGKLTDKKELFPELSKVVIQDFKDIYPELLSQQELVHTVLESEVEKFWANLERGQHILAKIVADKSRDNKKVEISGAEAFKLYDTYGFPLELTKVIGHDRGFTVDALGFEQEMNKQRERSNANAQQELHVDLDESIATEFTGYKELETQSHIIALIKDGKVVNRVQAGDECYVIAQKSPFFIVGGGQVPDQGWLEFKGNRVAHSVVRYINLGIASLIKAPVDLSVGDSVLSIVNEPLRTAAMKNHTATHMLQSALIQVLGSHVKQAGSLVHPDYLRFDFSYPENLTHEQITHVEDIVNKKIRENIDVTTEYTTLKDAQIRGALAFFGEKYKPENVRIVEIPYFSAELCGGTHVHATGDIGVFKITEVAAPSAGYRRIFAVTGHKAIALFQETFDIVKELSQQFSVKREEVLDSVEKQKETIKELGSEIKNLKKQLLKSQLPLWAHSITTVGTVPYLFLLLENLTIDDLRDILAALSQKNPGFYFLASNLEDKALFLCSATPDIASKVNLQQFGSWLKDTHGLRGGGSKNLLQGGGAKIDANLKEAIEQWLLKNQ